MSIRTDLALEQLELNQNITPTGIGKTEETRNGVLVIKVEIQSEEASQQLNKPIGTYYTLHVTDFKTTPTSFEDEVAVLAETIVSLLPNEVNNSLVIGLGNSDITPDALGPQAISYLLATRHIDDALKEQIGLSGLKSVCALIPGVLGQTGIESAEFTSAITQQVSPDVVIVIDALAAKSIERLGTTVQISDTGISPGSGVQNKRKELSQSTLGVPVIAIGVPMVVDMATAAQDISQNEAIVSEKAQTMMVTPREIDLVIEHAAKLVAHAINKALQPNLSLEEIMALVN